MTHLFQGHQRHKKREEHAVPQSYGSVQLLQLVISCGEDPLLLHRQVREPIVQPAFDEQRHAVPDCE